MSHNMGIRICASCFEPLKKSEYAEKQWKLGKGVSLCHQCEKHTTASSVVATARHNISDKAKFDGYDLNHPFASGSFRWVAKGRYTAGPRKGEPCVCKWFKEGGVVQKHYFASDVAAAEMATRLIESWNKQRFIPKVVRINLPQVWTSSKPPHVKVLAEPFIENYKKFNSNSGWADNGTDWACVMQAMSHYSFHVSKGNLLLCDLQGGIGRDGAYLTDPVVMSFTREYGPTDLGRQGIQNFFANHQCNKFCRSHWLKPRERTHFHRAVARTMMVPAGTQSSLRSTVTVKRKKNNVVIQEEIPIKKKPGFLARAMSARPKREPLREIPAKKPLAAGPLRAVSGRPAVSNR